MQPHPLSNPYKDTAFHAVCKLTEDDLRPVQLKDFKMACQAQKASVHPDEIQRYIEYNAKHGAQLARNGVAMGAESDDDW
jgi:hypothetical protein